MKTERNIPAAEAGQKAAEVRITESQPANEAPKSGSNTEETEQLGAGDTSETQGNTDISGQKDNTSSVKGAKDSVIDLAGYIHTSTGMQKVTDFETIKVTKNGVCVLGKYEKVKDKREVIFYIDVRKEENRIVLAKQIARAIAETLNGKKTTPIDWSLAD